MSLESFRDGYVELFVFDGDDHIAMLVVAEHASTSPAKPVEGLGSRVPVRVVRADLYNGYLRREAVEEQRRRGGIRPVVRHFQEREGTEVQTTPRAAYPSAASPGVTSSRSIW